MSEIEYWHEDLDEALTQLADEIAKLSSGGDSGRAAGIKAADTTISRIKNLRKSYTLELRQLSGEDKELYKDRLADHDKKLEQLETELKWARSEGDRKALMKGAKREGKKASEMSGDEMLTEAERLQDKTAESLKSSLSMLEESREVGMATAEKMVENTETIGRIHEEVKSMDDSLNRADKLLRAFARRMYTDKLITCLLFIVVIGVVLVIVSPYIAPDSQVASNVPDVAVPPDPREVAKTKVNTRRMLRGLTGISW